MRVALWHSEMASAALCGVRGLDGYVLPDNMNANAELQSLPSAIGGVDGRFEYESQSQTGPVTHYHMGQTVTI